MPHYIIDVWKEDSIWSWAGEAAGEDDAQELARQELNCDWDCEYETWNDLAEDMDGTALRYDDRSELIDVLCDLLDHVHDTSAWEDAKAGNDPAMFEVVTRAEKLLASMPL